MSKKFILNYLPFILMLVFIAIAYKPISVNVNNQPISFSVGPILINKSIIVPVKEIANILDADVIINTTEQTILIYNNSSYIKFLMGEKKCIINGEIHYLNIEPQTINKTIMVPLKSVVKSFGAEFEKDIRFSGINVAIKLSIFYS